MALNGRHQRDTPLRVTSPIDGILRIFNLSWERARSRTESKLKANYVWFTSPAGVVQLLGRYSLVPLVMHEDRVWKATQSIRPYASSFRLTVQRMRET